MTGRRGAGGAPTVLVAAVGNEYRADDGAGPLLVRRLAGSLPAGTGVCVVADPLELIGRWDGVRLAVVADAMRSGAPPGTVTVVDLDGVPDAGEGCTTHTVGLGRALRLARAVDRAPRRAVVVAVEGAVFGDGHGLSPEVAAAVPRAARRVLALVREALECA